MKRNKQEPAAVQRMQRQRKPTAKCLDLVSNAFFSFGSKKQHNTSKQCASTGSLETIKAESNVGKKKNCKQNIFGKHLNTVAVNGSEDDLVLNDTVITSSPKSSSSFLPQKQKSYSPALSVESFHTSDEQLMTKDASVTVRKSGNNKIHYSNSSSEYDSIPQGITKNQDMNNYFAESDVVPHSITKNQIVDNSSAESDQCSNVVTFGGHHLKIGNEHLVSNLPDLIQGNTKDRHLDVSDTFITIETKDGLSSEKMPFSQFLKKVVVEQESGNLKIDLSQLLSSFTPSAEDSNGGQRDKLLPNHLPQSSQMDLENESVGSKVRGSHSSEPDSTTVSDKPVKRRGRPSKQKQSSVLSSEVKTKGGFSSNNNSSVSELKLLHDSSKRTDFSELSVKVKEKPGFSHHHPRRSTRTPAKSSRFGDDFVDSITLGKIVSSSSSWNTQLMTLALAAETHKNKPSKTSGQGIVDDEDHDVPENMDDDDDNNDLILSAETQNPKKESDSKTNCEPINGQDGYKKAAVDEKKKRMSNNCLRGPKTLKKYEPVDPVVKRSLNEALTLAAEATKDLGNELTENACSSSIYYTIMEPKLEAKGNGLMVHKSEQGINYRIVNFCGSFSDDNQISNPPKSYPQDRYFFCDLCENIFLSTNNWLQHNKYAHSRTIDNFETSLNKTDNKAEYKCKFCDQKFPYKFMLDIHIKRKRHSEVKTFKCTLCKETFATHKSREEHWVMSHPTRSCGLCGKQFTNIVMLRRHINHNCHGARFRKRMDILEVNNESSSIFRLSDKSFETDCVEESDSGNIDDDIKESVEETDVEDSSEDTEDDLLNSNIVKNESGKVECDHCGTEFSTYSGLWYHKLDEHHEYYPPGHRDKLQEKLEKNEIILQNAQDASLHKDPEANKNSFFIIMKPKWPPHKSNLSVSIEEKEFIFKPDEGKMSERSPENDAADIAERKETSFKCLQCDETFQFANSYREHRNQVHGESFEVLRMLGAFQCTLCSETYPYQFMLDRHIKNHMGKKLLPCTLCGLFFHKIQERRLHWKTAHPGIGCPNCGKMYASIKYLQKHISLNCQDHFPPTKKFLEFQKKQLSDFEMPDSVKKVEKKILQCHLCPKLCSSVHGWRRHMSEAHEDSGFTKLSNTCIICNELVYGYKALEKHLLENHAVDTGLPVEEEDGIVKDALKKCEIDITAYRKAGRDDSDIYQDEKGNYHCPSCPKTHTDIKALRTHIRIHVNMKLECSVCNKIFKNPTLLKQHVQRHRKDAVYSCESCKKKFLTLQKLNKHRKVHHSTGNFVCDLCEMSFALNDYLQKHKRCHTDKRPHCCTVCGKSFRTKPELRVHVLIHTRETPFKCQYCDRGFSQKGNYRIHLAQHTGEKPYQCDQCEVSFALHCHLKRHKVTHDQKIHYRCMWCDKECTQRKHMQMHVQRVHKEDFYQYEEQMKLEAPVPIAPSQVKLYNRRLGKVNKVRKQYRTRAQKCDTTIQQLVNGIVTKPEPMDEDTETSQNIIIEPIVEQMMETVTCEMSVGSHESANFEILVSEDHQHFTKHAIPVDLLGQDPSNVEIVVDENNEINIIIKDPSALQDILGDQSMAHLTSGQIEVQKSLQQVVEALVNRAKHVCDDDDAQLPLDISDLDKSTLSGTSQMLSFDST